MDQNYLYAESLFNASLEKINANSPPKGVSDSLVPSAPAAQANSKPNEPIADKPVAKNLYAQFKQGKKITANTGRPLTAMTTFIKVLESTHKGDKSVTVAFFYGLCLTAKLHGLYYQTPIVSNSGAQAQNKARQQEWSLEFEGKTWNAGHVTQACIAVRNIATGQTAASPEVRAFYQKFQKDMEYLMDLKKSTIAGALVAYFRLDGNFCEEAVKDHTFWNFDHSYLLLDGYQDVLKCAKVKAEDRPAAIKTQANKIMKSFTTYLNNIRSTNGDGMVNQILNTHASSFAYLSEICDDAWRLAPLGIQVAGAILNRSLYNAGLNVDTKTGKVGSAGMDFRGERDIRCGNMIAIKGLWVVGVPFQPTVEEVFDEIKRMEAKEQANPDKVLIAVKNGINSKIKSAEAVKQVK